MTRQEKIDMIVSQSEDGFTCDRYNCLSYIGEFVDEEELECYDEEFTDKGLAEEAMDYLRKDLEKFTDEELDEELNNVVEV